VDSKDLDTLDKNF